MNSVSKSYCMTGWRIGFAAGPAELIAAMESVQSHSTSCPNPVPQWAAVAALKGDQQYVETLRAEMDVRRRMAVSGFGILPGISCMLPQGWVGSCRTRYCSRDQKAVVSGRDDGLCLVIGGGTPVKRILVVSSSSGESWYSVLCLMSARLRFALGIQLAHYGLVSCR
ncbi:MAG: aminotransferase class I/II-fold pyridoxal phosphate-dependent enzyme [Bacillota bacterium]|nr:aminotransferase class I/II-fold pyridoxal phosphate-dependent enzyme [Bacillota bacterium]